MERLYKLMSTESRKHKLILSCGMTPNKDYEMQIFAKEAAGHPVEGSDLLIAYARDKDFYTCKELLIGALEMYTGMTEG